MDYKTLQKNFERELLVQIIQNMRVKKLNKKGAKKVAKAFLPTLTCENTDQFIERNARLCEFYPEIMEAFLITIKDYEERLRVDRLNLAREKLTKVGELHGSN